ncbi:hypothetical protein BJ878DRAFT_560323 [Calycina marina]|uniref:Uncharacterized protein n=1 Tax=Calycina marina TaxID=1763456 RepID=A0A9P7YWE4_9HELO|nr:hypothetical protein BJ878DRAFT_560323 [Calycina marina]
MGVSQQRNQDGEKTDTGKRRYSRWLRIIDEAIRRSAAQINSSTEYRTRDGTEAPIIRRGGLLGDRSFATFFSGMKEDISTRLEKVVPDFVAISSDRVSSVVRIRQSDSVNNVAKAMNPSSKAAVDIAFNDLEDMARWLNFPANAASKLDKDGIRENMVQRFESLTRALPEKWQASNSIALMHTHTEHGPFLKYISGDITMLGDTVTDTSKQNFWVKEDGYAWDLEELIQAIRINGGIMRNPMTKQMFTTNDIKAIVTHPLGKKLDAVDIEQKKLKLGMRPAMIDALDKLQTALMEDQNVDRILFRHAVDSFMAFMVTLPADEQNSLDKLRVPAVDS